MKQEFLESTLPATFRQRDINQIKKLIDQSTSFTVVGIPGMGISAFLKYLATQEFAYFIHVDLYTLPKLDKESFFNLISQYELASLVKKYNRIVIVFNRFDQIKDAFDASFFSNLRSLVEIHSRKIVLIFSSNKPLYEWNQKAFERTNLDTFSKNFYLKPYSKDEMLDLLKINIHNLDIDQELLERCLHLSAGHFQLFQLLLKSDRSDNFLSDEFVLLQLKRIYEESFNNNQRQQLQKLALGKETKIIDLYLFDLGVVKQIQGTHTIFSELFESYIKHITLFTLSPLENKLFRLLEKNKETILAKEEIFEHLWRDEPDKQSDWALNALIYRIRKNPAFVEKGYAIKSHKKLGYSLT